MKLSIEGTRWLYGALIVLAYFAMAAVVAEGVGRKRRCAYCHRPYAFWNRGSDNVCKKHRKQRPVRVFRA